MDRRPLTNRGTSTLYRERSEGVWDLDGGSESWGRIGGRAWRGVGVSGLTVPPDMTPRPVLNLLLLTEEVWGGIGTFVSRPKTHVRSLLRGLRYRSTLPQVQTSVTEETREEGFKRDLDPILPGNKGVSSFFSYPLKGLRRSCPQPLCSLVQYPPPGWTESRPCLGGDSVRESGCQRDRPKQTSPCFRRGQSLLVNP